MRLIERIRSKMRSMRRRIIVAVSTLFISASLLSSIWIYFEIKHEVNELFDAELVQQARVLDGLLAVALAQQSADSLRQQPRWLKHAQQLAHPYENKLAFRVETASGDLLLSSDGIPAPAELPFQPGFSQFAVDGDYWYAFGMANAAHDFRVVVMQEDSFRGELRIDLAVDTLVPIVVLLPFVLWACRWLVNYFFYHFSRVATHLRDRRSDDYSPIQQLDNSDEVGAVVNAVNSYLSRTEQAFVRERRFSADAAHELRTPLAALKAQLQQLQPSNAAEGKAVAAALLSTQRLIDLVQQLLVLARAEQTQRQFQRFNLAALTRESLASYYANFELAGLQLVADVPQHCQIESDAQAWRLMLSNLLDNALKYAERDSTVTVTLRKTTRRGDLDGYQLVVNNQVDNAAEIDADRVFDRFYRGRQLDRPGSGLGMSIVANIAKQLAVTIEFRLQDQQVQVMLNG
ncbi:ATP-binding protein [Idiomarina xiamenensis]|uniref:histidine kinase n=1 Tax=Idiomarina xiamenensis 10-D-4 TaxID=740709 RepID=K2KPB2_9GAMM|nr:ATP-binding protein [Idiomarina xiamenensis]EKE84204.1 signal transduction histidine kinase [Idiomarina xiamenensis 10-D-4]